MDANYKIIFPFRDVTSSVWKDGLMILRHKCRGLKTEKIAVTILFRHQTILVKQLQNPNPTDVSAREVIVNRMIPRVTSEVH